MSLLNTNAAYNLALAALRAVRVDVEALGRDCRVHVSAMMPEGNSGNRFVPVYWVEWSLETGGSPAPAASVEIFKPTRETWQLKIWRSKYILRKPLALTDTPSAQMTNGASVSLHH